MNTHLLMYANAQDHARRSSETWHYPHTRAPRSTGRVWTRIRDSFHPTGQAPAPATGFAATASLMTAVAWI